jgi:hypothetical protein
MMQIIERTIKDAPWLWITKNALEIIREFLDSEPKNMPGCLATYLALAEIASNYGQNSFICAQGTIGFHAGLSRQSVGKHLKELNLMGLINIEKRTKAGKDISSRYILIAIKHNSPGVKDDGFEPLHNKRNEEINRKEKKKTIDRVQECSEEFKRFWKAFPRKVGKGAAWKVFSKIDPNDELVDKMIETVADWKKSKDWIKDGGQFIPYPATWLNQERWEDELMPEDLIDDEEQSNYIPSRTFE